MPQHSFDLQILTSVTVKADSEEEARDIIRDRMHGVEANFGAWENGDPIVAEISVPESGITHVDTQEDGDDI